MATPVGMPEIVPQMDTLLSYAHNVHSQYGEDGIIAHILSLLKLPIGRCIEFGAWDGMHLSNTANLWKNGWEGVLIELDQGRFKSLAKNTAGHRCHCICAKVEPIGANSLENILRREGLPLEADVLSIDVDGDDYHIWAGIENLRPRLVICEYNPTVPPSVQLVPTTGNYMGCSALSLQLMAQSKGYKLVCVTLSNCLFVREEDADAFSSYETNLEKIFPRDYLCNLITGFDGRFVLTNCPPFGLSLPSRQKLLSVEIERASLQRILRLAASFSVRRHLLFAFRLWERLRS